MDRKTNITNTGRIKYETFAECASMSFNFLTPSLSKPSPL